MDYPLAWIWTTMPIKFFHAFTWGVKAWHAAHRNILPLPELSEWTIALLCFQAKKLPFNHGNGHSDWLTEWLFLYNYQVIQRILISQSECSNAWAQPEQISVQVHRYSCEIMWIFVRFLSITLWFVILTENVNVVPAGTDSIFSCSWKLSTIFVLQFIPAENSLSFSSHGISGCRFPLNVPLRPPPPPPPLKVSTQMCYENNFIKLNWIVSH